MRFADLLIQGIERPRQAEVLVIESAVLMHNEAGSWWSHRSYCRGDLPAAGDTVEFWLDIERCSDHWKIISVAGWSYRTNDRGWIIYRDPQTGRAE